MSEVTKIRHTVEEIALDAIHRMNDQEPTALEYQGEVRLSESPAAVLLALEHSTVLRCIADALDDAIHDGVLVLPEAP